MTGWREATLLELADGKREFFNDGDWIEAPYITHSGNRLLQTGNVGVGRLRNRGTKRYVSDDSFRALRCKEVVPGDILICRLADPAGRACLVEDIGERRMLTSVDVTIFRPNSRRTDRRFLVAVFSTPEWFQEIDERCGGSTRTRIARSELGKIRLRVPELEEQIRIADALEDVDNFISTLERLIAKKQAIKQGMMQQLLTGKTRLPGFVDGWQSVKLGSAARMKSGGTPLSSVSRFYGGHIPWVSISDMTSGGKFISETASTLTDDGLENSAATLYDADVVLYAMYASLGECSLAVGRVSSSQAILGISTGPRLNQEFLYYYLQSIKAQVKLLGQHGTQSNLNARMVREFEIPMPPLDEQRAIVETLRDTDTHVVTLQERLSKARAVKTGMMQELLTGRTRLPVEASS